jgi:DNA-binding transcriptional ArsR family regulator
MVIKRGIQVESLAFRIKADFLKALSHPTRLAIVEYLKGGEASVGKAGADLRLEQSSLSKHLAVLRQAGIVAARHDKSSVLYSIQDKAIFRILRPIARILMKKLKTSGRILGGLG